MAITTDLQAMHGYNKVSGSEKLIAVWARAPYIYNSSTGKWDKQAVTLTSGQKAEFRTFLDQVFLVNGFDPNYNYDNSSWSATRNLNDSPIGAHIEKDKVRLYLLDVIIAGTRYSSRVWFSDLPKNNAITWGLETGDDLSQTSGSGVVTSSGSLFRTRNIKVGDPFTITTGSNTGEYIVQSVDSETQVTLTTNLSNTTTGSSFWVGGNFFDVETDDGDVGRGFGKNSNELLIYKRNTLWRYNEAGRTLRQVKGSVGTTSGKSIVNNGDYTYAYHPSGIYRCNGTSTILISNAIEDYIEGITVDMQSFVVGWVENEDIICFYVGDVTLRDGEIITNCVIAWDTVTETWSPRSLPVNIRAATVWSRSNVPGIYVGDDNSHVFQLDTGTDFNGDPIPFSLEKAVFPAGYNAIVDFNRIRVCVEDGPDIGFEYKLLYKPTQDEGIWDSDVSWRPMTGSSRGSRSEFLFDPTDCRASGVILRPIESSIRKSFNMEKITLYYSNIADS